MSKGGGRAAPAPAAKPPVDPGPCNFVTGIQPYPANGQFPIVPQQNYWENGNFMMPGQSTPVMNSDMLSRFPQLATLFGGRSPDVQTASGVPGMAGFPPTFGTLKPNPVTGKTDPKKKAGPRSPRERLTARFRGTGGTNVA